MEKRVMSMSRRQFTKEFKEAAVRRLELGASLAEVARACEVNPNVLHRWKRELQEHGVKAFAGSGRCGRRKTGSPNWNARWDGKPCKTIFCEDACSMPRSSAGCKHCIPAAPLSVHRERNKPRYADSRVAAACAGAGGPGWRIPLAARPDRA